MFTLLWLWIDYPQRSSVLWLITFLSHLPFSLEWIFNFYFVCLVFSEPITNSPCITLPESNCLSLHWKASSIPHSFRTGLVFPSLQTCSRLDWLQERDSSLYKSGLAILQLAQANITCYFARPLLLVCPLSGGVYLSVVFTGDKRYEILKAYKCVKCVSSILTLS